MPDYCRSSPFSLVRGRWGVLNPALFRNLPAEAWPRRGIASNQPISVRALAYVIVGHVRHHAEVLEARYG